MTRSITDRFWSFVDRTDPDWCWEWTGAKIKGHGVFRGDGRQVRAGRFAYELLVGPIPEGLHIDHLCENRPCVNPKHLEPVTQKVNTLRGKAPSAINARKTHCPRGHPLSGDNLQVFQGRRCCRECKRAACRAYYYRTRS